MLKKLINSIIRILHGKMTVYDIQKGILTIIYKKDFNTLYKVPGIVVSVQPLVVVIYGSVKYNRVMEGEIVHSYGTLKQLMHNVYNSCQYCGDIEDLTIDHIVPKSLGGKDNLNNLTIACIKCNTNKKNATLNMWSESLYSRVDPYASIVKSRISRYLAGIIDIRHPVVHTNKGLHNEFK